MQCHWHVPTHSYHSHIFWRTFELHFYRYDISGCTKETRFAYITFPMALQYSYYSDFYHLALTLHWKCNVSLISLAHNTNSVWQGRFFVCKKSQIVAPRDTFRRQTLYYNTWYLRSDIWRTEGAEGAKECGIYLVVTHLSTNQDQHCLTSVI
jgi:hypothetical protein